MTKPPLIKRMAEGLDIISRQAGADLAVEHDILYAGSRTPLPDTDQERLKELGWHWDEAQECWAIFV